MALIARDLMVGNPVLAEMGFAEQRRPQCPGRRLPGAAGSGTDYFPNGDFLEAILTTSFDWNGIRQPYIGGDGERRPQRASMLFGHLLTGTAQLSPRPPLLEARRRSAASPATS